MIFVGMVVIGVFGYCLAVIARLSDEDTPEIYDPDNPEGSC